MAKGSGGGGGRGKVRAATPQEWAAGVRAARDLGGQVPQRAVNEADRILSRSATRGGGLPKISRKEIAALEASGRVVSIQKRKKIAVVSGYRRYQITG